jgi:hypothetical protein
MKQKTLLIFQLFLIIFAFYALLKYTGSQRFLIALACLISMFVVGKVETDSKKTSEDDLAKKDATKTTSHALDRLLKSKNVQVLIDAIQCLLQDLGMVVSPSQDHTAISRLVRIPGMEVTFGLKILGDVEELDENWDKWEKDQWIELDSFDLGKGGEQRSLIICSNWVEEAGDRPVKYKNFSENVHKLLSSRKIVAMTTLTLYQIYMSCKKNNKYINKIFHHIQNHPGGILQLKSSAKKA